MLLFHALGQPGDERQGKKRHRQDDPLGERCLILGHACPIDEVIGKNGLYDGNGHPTEDFQGQGRPEGLVARHKAHRLTQGEWLHRLEFRALAGSEKRDQQWRDEREAADQADGLVGLRRTRGEHRKDDQPEEQRRSQSRANRDGHAVRDQRRALIVVQGQLRHQRIVGTSNGGSGRFVEDVGDGIVGKEQHLVLRLGDKPQQGKEHAKGDGAEQQIGSPSAPTGARVVRKEAKERIVHGVPERGDQPE